jgi:hypothetical protein
MNGVSAIAHSPRRPLPSTPAMSPAWFPTLLVLPTAWLGGKFAMSRG